MMEIRYASHPDDFEAYTTERTRREFLVQDLFIPDQIKLIYSHNDRMVIGGACPLKPVQLQGGKALGTDSFLERREMGIINVGGSGTVSLDGETYALQKNDALYIGLGSAEPLFSSDDPSQPAHFYMLSGTAHHEYPTRKISMDEADSIRLGSPEASNVRVLRKYIHPDGVKSCNLVMGVTAIESGSVWNSMPCHTHERRMEVYFYYDLAEDAVLFHLMGQPDKTRHIVVRNEEAVISPSWSIHAGAGTSAYTFIWGMVGDNQVFGDMDGVSMDDLK